MAAHAPHYGLAAYQVLAVCLYLVSHVRFIFHMQKRFLVKSVECFGIFTAAVHCSFQYGGSAFPGRFAQDTAYFSRILLGKAANCGARWRRVAARTLAAEII